jgi:putative N6-adenine-specific DNA methylase
MRIPSAAVNPAPPTLPLFLPCAAGVEGLLAEEVQRLLPGLSVRSPRGGVSLSGGVSEVMALNLGSRLAQRVLVQVAHGPYHDEADLYHLALGVEWANWITPQHTLRVDTTAHRCPLKSLNFAALRIKDAVCDQLREETGERPNVDTSRPDLPLLLHLDEREATLYVDSSGEALFKRGWREDAGDAPLKETLAAAMLAAAGWRGTREAGGALHDPCCGSGTIAIEAAQIACGIAPGLKRRFAFQQQLPFCAPAQRADWQRRLSAAQAAIHASAVPIFASDVSFRMVDFARRNAQRAGVEHAITFNGGDALERPAPELPPDMPGTLMLNPPYGERIEALGKAAPSARGHGRRAAYGAPPGREPGTQREAPSAAPPDDNRSAAPDFFARLASHWKRAYTAHAAGWNAYVLSPDMKLPSTMRLKESRRVPLWNGPIECRLFRFDLIAGSARAPRAAADAAPAPTPRQQPDRA